MVSANQTLFHFQVTGAVSSAFIVASALGEMLLPLLVGVAFKKSLFALFPAILLAALAGLAGIVAALFILRRMTAANGAGAGAGGGAMALAGTELFELDDVEEDFLDE